MALVLLIDVAILSFRVERHSCDELRTDLPHTLLDRTLPNTVWSLQPWDDRLEVHTNATAGGFRAVLQGWSGQSKMATTP